MGELSPWHLLILAGVFVLLFGAKRLPDGARSLGRSLRIFKTEVKGLNDDDQAQTPAGQGAQHPQPLPAAPTPAAPTTPAAAAPPTTAPPTVTETEPAAQQQHEAR
jgi:sec-independent protein translocase protein TatA